MAVDETPSTEYSLNFNTYDPRYTPSPVIGVDPFAEPTYSLTLNADWWSHIEGVIERLAWRDAWIGDTEEQQQQAVDDVIKILDAIASPKVAHGEFCNQWLSANAIPTSLWTVISWGSYYAPDNIYFGTYINNVKSIQIEAVINKPLTHISFTVVLHTEASGSTSDFLRLYNDDVLIYQQGTPDHGQYTYSYRFGGTEESPRPHWVGKLRLLLWINDPAPGDPDTFLFLTDLLIEGWGDTVELTSVCT